MRRWVSHVASRKNASDNPHLARVGGVNQANLGDATSAENAPVPPSHPRTGITGVSALLNGCFAPARRSVSRSPVPGLTVRRWMADLPQQQVGKAPGRCICRRILREDDEQILDDWRIGRAHV